jgi:hypothetical protein
MSGDDEDVLMRRHLEVLEAIRALSQAQHTVANEVLELREQLVPGLRPHAAVRYAPHFASLVAVALAAAALSLTLGACKP